MTVTITADVDKAKGTVLLSSDQPGLDLPGETFRVAHGDTVRWKVRGALGGLRMQVRLTEFRGRDQPEQRGRLFKEGTKDTLPADAAAVVGTVHPTADAGHYRYEVTLVGGPKPILLRCLWTPGPGRHPQVLEPPMGGGVQTSPPPRG